VPFTFLAPHLFTVAQQALAHCKSQYGAQGLKIEEGINTSISWRPTFYLKPRKFELFAVEVNDLIFPDAIKGAAHDIRHYDGLIRVSQVIPLEVYQTDRGQTRIKLLRNQGFGAITVDNEGDVVTQFDCVPLSQFITDTELEESIKELPSQIKVRLRTAHKTYLTNPTQGVQDAGQILEGLILSIAKQSARSTNISNTTLKGTAANLIDAMYTSTYFKDHRAALGGVRNFMAEYRNPTSHAPKTAKVAAQRVRNLREGFIHALRCMTALAKTAGSLGLKAIIYG
jgi:hypothetical protein